MTLETDDMDLAGDIIQSLAEYLQLEVTVFFLSEHNFWLIFGVPEAPPPPPPNIVFRNYFNIWLPVHNLVCIYICVKKWLTLG